MSNFQSIQLDAQGEVIDPQAVTIELTKPESHQGGAQIRDLDAERIAGRITSNEISGKAAADIVNAQKLHADLLIEFEDNELMISYLDELGDDASADQKATRKRMKERRIHARHDLGMAWVRSGNPLSDIT